jgi:hypothetical protein
VKDAPQALGLPLFQRGPGQQVTPEGPHFGLALEETRPARVSTMVPTTGPVRGRPRRKRSWAEDRRRNRR